MILVWVWAALLVVGGWFLARGRRERERLAGELVRLRMERRWLREYGDRCSRVLGGVDLERES